MLEAHKIEQRQQRHAVETRALSTDIDENFEIICDDICYHQNIIYYSMHHIVIWLVG